MPICKSCRYLIFGWCKKHQGRRPDLFCCRLHQERPHYGESLVVRHVRTLDPVEQVRRAMNREDRLGTRAAVSRLKRNRRWIEIDDPQDDKQPLTSRVRAAIRLFGPIDAEGVLRVIGHTDLKKVRSAINVQRRRLRVKCIDGCLWVLCGEDLLQKDTENAENDLANLHLQ